MERHVLQWSVHNIDNIHVNPSICEPQRYVSQRDDCTSGETKSQWLYVMYMTKERNALIGQSSSSIGCGAGDHKVSTCTSSASAAICCSCIAPSLSPSSLCTSIGKVPGGKV